MDKLEDWTVHSREEQTRDLKEVAHDLDTQQRWEVGQYGCGTATRENVAAVTQCLQRSVHFTSIRSHPLLHRSQRFISKFLH